MDVKAYVKDNRLFGTPSYYEMLRRCFSGQGIELFRDERSPQNGAPYGS